MALNDQINSLKSIKKWWEYYQEQAEIAFYDEDITKIEELRKELLHFLFSIQEKYISNPLVQLDKSQDEWLRKLASELLVLDSQLVSRITIIRLDQEMLQEMDQLALPDDTELRVRDFTTWGHSPMSFPQGLLEALKVASVPGGN